MRICLNTLLLLLFWTICYLLGQLRIRQRKRFIPFLTLFLSSCRSESLTYNIFLLSEELLFTFLTRQVYWQKLPSIFVCPQIQILRLFLSLFFFWYSHYAFITFSIIAPWFLDILLLLLLFSGFFSSLFSFANFCCDIIKLRDPQLCLVH